MESRLVPSHVAGRSEAVLEIVIATCMLLGWFLLIGSLVDRVVGDSTTAWELLSGAAMVIVAWTYIVRHD